jgi:hypothetical protein
VKHLIFLLIFSFSVLFSDAQGSIMLEDKEFPVPVERNGSILAWVNQFPAINSLAPDEKDVVYWINYVRENPKEFYNTYFLQFLREFPGIENAYTNSLRTDLLNTKPMNPLAPSILLNNTSYKHARDLAENAKRLSHNSTNGKSFQQRMTDAGIKICAEENIYEGKRNALEAVILLLIDNNTPGVGHRKTILDRTLHSIGVSFAGKKNGVGYILVQDFSCD